VYGGLRFFERQEIKHALAYLRLTANPEDDGAFLRVANFPARGIGGRTLEQLQASAEGAAVSLWRAACGNAPAGKAGTSLAAFVRLIEDLRAATRDLPLPEIVEHVIEASGLVAHYKGEKEGAERVENLEELVNAATAFAGEEGFAIYSADRTDGAPEAAAASNAPETGARRENVGRSDALNAFLSHAALEAGEHQAAAGADALQLMTVHSAKGLEFDTVFDGGLEEERRLMYVAITRARRRLHLTHAQTRMLHGHTRYNVASRFLDEIPAALVRRVSASAALPALPPSAAGALPARAAASLRSYTAGGFRIGQSVTHPKFGAGVIVQAEGRGADARVQVNFRDAGLKWLALEYARLQAV